MGTASGLSDKWETGSQLLLQSTARILHSTLPPSPHHLLETQGMGGCQEQLTRGYKCVLARRKNGSLPGVWCGVCALILVQLMPWERQLAEEQPKAQLHPAGLHFGKAGGFLGRVFTDFWLGILFL